MSKRVTSGIVTDLRPGKQQMTELGQLKANLAAAMAEKERMEVMLRQAREIEAMGQLISGIAHDFNNLLTVIGVNLELVRARMSDERLAGRIDASQRAVSRCTELTDQLLAVSRCQSLRPRPISINALLLDIEVVVRRAMREERRRGVAGPAATGPTEPEQRPGSGAGSASGDR
jgi:signal transduction histidine kinase